jgi:hypothetical protein
MNQPEHETRISVLETKIDTLTEAIERIEQKLDSISLKQMDFEVDYRVARGVGRLLVAAVVTLGGWLSWDTIVAFLHPKH